MPTRRSGEIPSSRDLSRRSQAKTEADEEDGIGLGGRVGWNMDSSIDLRLLALPFWRPCVGVALERPANFTEVRLAGMGRRF